MHLHASLTDLRRCLKSNNIIIIFISLATIITILQLSPMHFVVFEIYNNLRLISLIINQIWFECRLLLFSFEFWWLSFLHVGWYFVHHLLRKLSSGLLRTHNWLWIPRLWHNIGTICHNADVLLYTWWLHVTTWWNWLLSVLSIIC